MSKVKNKDETWGEATASQFFGMEAKQWKGERELISAELRADAERGKDLPNTLTSEQFAQCIQIISYYEKTAPQTGDDFVKRIKQVFARQRELSANLQTYKLQIKEVKDYQTEISKLIASAVIGGDVDCQDLSVKKILKLRATLEIVKIRLMNCVKDPNVDYISKLLDDVSSFLEQKE